MTKLEEVSTRLATLPYMQEKQAAVLRDLIAEADAANILEIGFFHGKSSALIGAILEDRGKGHLTTIDLEPVRAKEPNIVSVLEDCGLSHRVEPIFAHRSFTWELRKMLSAKPRPSFDLCYFDGGHHWDTTGFGVQLVGMLLRPGGILVLDDMDWSIGSSAYFRAHPERSSRYSPDERKAKSVRLVWDLLLPELGFTHVREVRDLHWGIARKGPAHS